MEADRILPHLTIDTSEFFESAARGELRIRACLDCGHFLHLPREICRFCGSTNLEWRLVNGGGHLYSWTVVRRQAHPSFPVPYCVVLVELDEAPGVRLPGYLAGSPSLVAGQPMSFTFSKLTDDIGLPQFEPTPIGD